ncbi:MAG: hypothetical protein FJY37_10980 [Betaproteobacteria bacterium]|nr:hypothetical protein [Betaproteobacteria bacterium]
MATNLPSPSPLHQRLNEVENRLRWGRRLRIAAWILCAFVFGAVLIRALGITQVHQPLWAVLLLLGILGFFGFGTALVREVLRQRVGLSEAARVADARGGLHDELTSALWFDRQPDASSWISAHLARAARTAGGLNPGAVAPVRLPRSLWGAAVLAVLFYGLTAVAPSMRESLARLEESGAAAEQARNAAQIRALIKQTDNPDVAQKLEQALAALEKKDASSQEKRKLLADAKEAVEQHNMEMNSMREGLMQLAERLRNSKEKSGSGEDGNPERADRAKELLERMMDQRARQPHSADLDPESLAREQELQKLLEQASKLGGNDEGGRHLESAQPKAVVGRLEKIAKSLEAQAAGNSAIRQLSQMQQLQVQQTTVQSAGRYSQSQAQQNPLEGTPSPDSGNTEMKGGIMFRTAAVARGDKPSESQEGSKSGAAEGDSQADPVLGKKESPLAVKLKKEAIRKEGEEGETGAEGWYYSESRAQQSQVELQGVRANTRYAQGEAMDPEQISVKHRQVVKDYFLNLHEAKPQ